MLKTSSYRCVAHLINVTIEVFVPLAGIGTRMGWPERAS